MTIIDTPDYQRGTVNAQAVLAEPAPGVVSVTVGIPPNAETLIVGSAAFDAAANASVMGLTTGINYAGVKVASSGGVLSSSQFFFDVSAALDAEVEVEFSIGPPAAWYVYSDAGVHVVADASITTDSRGIQAVTSVIPGPAFADHPATEMLAANAATTTTAAIIAAPGLGFRIRVFTLAISSPTVGTLGVLLDGVAGIQLLGCVGGANAALTLPAQGYALQGNSPLDLVAAGGTGTVGGYVMYTIEIA